MVWILQLSSKSDGYLQSVSNAYLARSTGRRRIINGLTDLSYKKVRRKGTNIMVAGGDSFSGQDKKSTGYLITRNKTKDILYQNKGSDPVVFTNYK